MMSGLLWQDRGHFLVCDITRQFLAVAGMQIIVDHCSWRSQVYNDVSLWNVCGSVQPGTYIVQILREIMQLIHKACDSLLWLVWPLSIRYSNADVITVLHACKNSLRSSRDSTFGCSIFGVL